ncbi:diaminobutyrate aminotransferase apoenzyme [Melghirimyces thermohalophilus]|uniref:Diaminobutyrate--2-oxoglutarate transaminase n=2 Tax=Melghirimyces thermohalophilus TaxID=1236220 RepID=A0A1G6MZM6_9BACL|nr:diaminobutyrate aminotransferase apoenzyme [Melghirimyces thermohalophilus]
MIPTSETMDPEKTDMSVFEEVESEVRSYCRSFPTIFEKAKGYKLWDRQGREYIDFFAGAGTLNYGHNESGMQKRLIEYLTSDGIVHSLDMATSSKEEFLSRFQDVILKPRNLEYKVMFPGPTGTNAVESALKLARKVTGRQTVVSFTRGFHGMTLGSLAVTGNAFKRKGAGIPLTGAVSLPYDQYNENIDSLTLLERYLEDKGSGVDLPAAVILETVQGEGGINAASFEWLKQVEQICRRYDVLLIVDDIQAGCGRTGTFFSFEPAEIQPDIVCLSKSLSGYGVPFAVTLFRPDLDTWAPGEHNGTFRGHNLAFVAATEALRFWETDAFSREVQRKGDRVKAALQKIADKHPDLITQVRGRGLMLGMEFPKEGLADEVCSEAFKRGLIMETSGPNSEVVKLLPPLIIDDEGLDKGLGILEESIESAAKKIS